MTTKILEQKKQWLKALADDFSLSLPGRGRLHHYTSLHVLFNILENDAVWVSGTRFSNDSSEEILMKNEAFRDLNYMSDSFIMCFSDQADCLSQWRGYCANGGAAIEFDLKLPQTYSILHADYETSHHYNRVLNAPLPVLYVRQENLALTATSLSAKLLQDEKDGTYKPWTIEDIVPYFKDNAFKEEHEWRLLFGNKGGKLSKCVQFRTLHDGVKVPYMIVKAGDLGESYTACELDPAEYTPDALDEKRARGIPVIRIPQGSDQESVYYKVEKAVNNYNRDKNLKGRNRIRISCDGHLPIRQIMVAPTYDRDRTAEKIKRYCWSNYWLRNVDVVSSKIPYIPPSE